MNPIDKKIRDKNVTLALFLGLRPDEDQDKPNKPWWYFTGNSFTIFGDEKDLNFHKSLDRLALVYRKGLAFIEALEYPCDDDEDKLSLLVRNAALNLDATLLFDTLYKGITICMDHLNGIEDEDQERYKQYLPKIFKYQLDEIDPYHGKKVGDIYFDDTNFGYHIVDPDKKYGLKLNL
jgi:hypothetical protein